MVLWEAVTAISTAVTAIVIAATVAVGYRQIRVAAEQVEHLRRSTQLEGTMKIFAELTTPEFCAARLFVENELEARMSEQPFRDELLLPFQALDEGQHKEILVAQTFEKIGTYARHGLIDTVIVADNCGPLIREMWQKLEGCGYFAARRRNNPYSLENFEFLYDRAMDWYDNEDPPFRTSRRQTGKP
ncbi:MAG TPA: hypothetical protein VMF61_05355 [Candidatus Acidoferrales bacterium]|nr:hypothetical protein [Candidatus Acidoferrales bacterium]